MLGNKLSANNKRVTKKILNKWENTRNQLYTSQDNNKKIIKPNGTIPGRQPPHNILNFDNRIINGVEVSPPIPQSYPYMGMMVDIAGWQYCGCTLIHPNWALTAAHCFTGPPLMSINFGSHYSVNSPMWTPDGVEIFGADLYWPDFNNDGQFSLISEDYALLHLNGTSSFQPAGLYTANPSFGTPATTVGWGLTIPGDNSSLSPVARKANVPIVEGSGPYGNYEDYGIIYAGTGLADGTVCSGDSGGPLLIGNSTVGITSWVQESGCFGDYPAGWAGLWYALDWMQAVMGDDFPTTAWESPDYVCCNLGSGNYAYIYEVNCVQAGGSESSYSSCSTYFTWPNCQCLMDLDCGMYGMDTCDLGGWGAQGSFSGDLPECQIQGGGYSARRGVCTL